MVAKLDSFVGHVITISFFLFSLRGGQLEGAREPATHA